MPEPPEEGGKFFEKTTYGPVDFSVKMYYTESDTNDLNRAGDWMANHERRTTAKDKYPKKNAWEVNAMKKRMLSILLVLCMAAAWLPQTAAAAGEWEDQIWIGGTPVNMSTNMTSSD